MPVVAVNLSDKLFWAIRNLVEKDCYPSLEGFLEVASYNQLALERSVTPEEVIARGHRQVYPLLEEGRGAAEMASVPAPESAKTIPRRPRKKGRRGASGKKTARKKSPAATTPAADLDVDATLSRWTIREKPDAFPAAAATERRPADEHLWGQVNRLLPLKLVCRWVARTAAGADWPLYATASDRLADDAAAVGAVLERWDRSAGHKRDEVLATGLPRRGNSASRDRFLSQYLARVTRGGEVHPGAVGCYALAEVGEGRVMLTDRGLEFARLANPIMDRRESTSTTTLDKAETAFLRQQIKEYAPGEHQDMQSILGAVSAGKVTPTGLATAVRGQFPDNWSEIVFRTHISGLIARLADLRLLRRRWDGRNVQYDLGDTQQVKSFLGYTRRG